VYQDFYQLNHAPFAATPEADLASLSRRHQAVLERVVNGLNKQQSLMVLLGEAGLGQIALLRRVLADNSHSKYKTITIDIRKIYFQNQIHLNDIVKSIYQEIGYEIKYQASSDALIDLHGIFMEEHEKGSNFIIMIDHAHLLTREVLKGIPKLIDAYPFETPLAQLILLGEPDLGKRLRDPNLQQLKKRIEFIAEFDAFNRKESIAYIQRKLSLASSARSPKIFSNAAIHKIVKAAKGIPRNLNMLCTDALVAGYKRRKRPISPSIVKQVLNDFQGHHAHRTSHVAWLGAVVLLLALVAGITFRGALWNPLPVVAQWSQQAVDQVQFLFSEFTPQPKTLSSQAPQHVISPVPAAAPSAIPSAPSSSDDATRSPLPYTVPKPSPPKVVVETPMPSPPKVVVETPMPSPPKVVAETPTPPRYHAIENVANLIDQHFPKGGAFGLKVWSDKAPGEAYVEGEHLVLYVIAEAPAFLWIDYYQADGKIVHLLPRPLVNNHVQAGQRFALGGDDTVFQFQVAPPFGMEMLTVVASQQPIDAQMETAGGELNDAYIDRLSRQLQTYSAQGEAAAAYLRIQTQPPGRSRAKTAVRQSELSNGKP
jgi:general secretion pathway protein A